MLRSGADDIAEPLFLYLVDSLGFRALFRPKVIEYEDSRTIAVNGVRVRVPARAVMFDARGADSLRIELEVEDAAGTDLRQGAPSGRGSSGRYFIQMKGIARLSGMLGGVPISGSGTGFFETYR